MTARQTIQAIDIQINANRRALMARLRFVPQSAFEWQGAWDRCPDLEMRERDLYRQRGIAQQERDAAEHKAWQAEQRKQRRAEKSSSSLCPTCGFHTLAA